MAIFHGPLFIDAHRVQATQLSVEKGMFDLGHGPKTRIPGAFAVPGLCDSHLHLMGMGWALDQVDLMASDSVQEVRRRIAAWISENPEAPAVRGRSWNHTLFEKRRMPCAADLAGLTDKPIYLTRQDGHAAWVNQALLDSSSVGDETPNPFGGLIARDAAGKASGVFIDTAMPVVAAQLPAPSDSDVARWLAEGLRRCQAAGLTSVHDVDVPLQSFAELERLDAAGELGLRVYVYLRDEPRAWELLRERGFRWRGAGGRLTLMGIKFFADGALGSHGAAMLCPYCNDPGRGLVLLSDEQLCERVQRCQDLAFQSATHAIGDAANRSVISAIEKLRSRPGSPPLRHRIEHAQIVDLQDFDRLSRCQAIASMQPVHGTSDMPWAKAYIGAERLRGAYAWKRMSEHGVALAFGSDAPVESVCPLAGLQAAWRAESRSASQPESWLRDQCLSFEQSLAGFTSGSAFAVHEEKALGRIEPGFQADLTLLSADPRAQPRGWLDVEVVGTMVAGELL
jgi:predicted amidohydrolase YtcJ